MAPDIQWFSIWSWDPIENVILTDNYGWGVQSWRFIGLAGPSSGSLYGVEHPIEKLYLKETMIGASNHAVS